ncbi:hypothetical protein Tco_0561645 [Tanacetum coccineum]
MIQSWHSGSKRGSEFMENCLHVSLRSILWDAFIPSSEPIIITTMIASYRVAPQATYNTNNWFSSERSYPEGVVDLALIVGSHIPSRTLMVQFHIVKSTSKYNVILGRTAIQKLSMEVSTIKSVVEFPIVAGTTTVRSDYPGIDASLTTAIEEGNIREIAWEPITRDTIKEQKVIINPEYPNQPITISVDLSLHVKNQLVQLLANNLDVFAWKPSDMTGVPRELAKHSLGLNQYAIVIRQKRRCFLLERSRAMDSQVTDLIQAGNLTGLVPNLSRKPRDGQEKKRYIAVTIQILMKIFDEEKTAFYTNQGLFYYTKIPFGLKNVGATYHALIEKEFITQIGVNLEAYVDDMFKVEDGQFMGHIIDATGVRANPKKIQAILDMKPPKNLTEVQIHNGKLATLSQFLSQASEKQLPFFKVLIKCNKNKVFKWTNEAQAAFQDLKIFLTELLTLTALNPGKTRTPYLAASQEAIGSVLLVERNKV